jgi:hypothetical protein
MPDRFPSPWEPVPAHVPSGSRWFPEPRFPGSLPPLGGNREPETTSRRNRRHEPAPLAPWAKSSNLPRARQFFTLPLTSAQDDA